MKYCIASNAATNSSVPVPLSGDFCENLRSARALGYHAIEIHLPDTGALDIPALRRTMEETGMSIATLGTGTIYGRYGLHLCDADAANQERLFGMVRRFIDCAAQLSSRVTIGSIKGNILPGQDREKHLELMGSALKRMDEYAQAQGVTLLLEATNRRENNVLNTAREVAAMIDGHQLAHTRALLDVFHMNREEAECTQALEEARHVLGHIHFADDNRKYPGAGRFAFEPFVRKIREIGYDGVLSVECLPLPTPEEAARRAAAFFHQWFD